MWCRCPEHPQGFQSPAGDPREWEALELPGSLGCERCQLLSLAVAHCSDTGENTAEGGGRERGRGDWKIPLKMNIVVTSSTAAVPGRAGHTSDTSSDAGLASHPPFPSFFTPICFNPHPLLAPQNSHNPLGGAGTRAGLNSSSAILKGKTKVKARILMVFFCLCVCVCVFLLLFYLFFSVSNPTTGALRSVFRIFFLLLFEMHVLGHPGCGRRVGARGGFCWFGFFFLDEDSRAEVVWSQLS